MKEEVGHFLWIKAVTIVNIGEMLVCINEKNVMQKPGVWNNRHSCLETHFPPSCIMWPTVLEIKILIFHLNPLLTHGLQAQDLPLSFSFAKWILLWTSLESAMRKLFFSGRFFRRQTA